jgi:hypothetical protein
MNMRSTVLKPLSADSVLVEFRMKVPQRVVDALEEAGNQIGIDASEAGAQALDWFVEEAKCGRRIIKLGGMTRTRRKKASAGQGKAAKTVRPARKSRVGDPVGRAKKKTVKKAVKPSSK